MPISLLKPSVNLNTLKDGRGGIFTYYPQKDAVREWNYIVTFKGEERGNHHHEEFDEYIMFVEGHGCYHNKNGESVLVGPGDCVYLPRGTEHTFTPLSDCKMVAMLTKRWDECENPIVKS